MSWFRGAVVVAALASLTPFEGESLTAAGQESVAFEIRAPEEPLGTVVLNGVEIPLTVGMGSGAFRRPGDPPGVVYSVSDRGPNLGCSATLPCELEGENASGKVFPMPGYSPRIYQLKVVVESGFVEVVDRIVITSPSGRPVTGLPHPPGGPSSTEGAFDLDGRVLEPDPGGIDPEALVRLSDGSFWLSDEIGVSLLHVASDGRLLERITTPGVAAHLGDLGYPVSGGLSPALDKRQLNRGIEALAISPDEGSLYLILQSPLEEVEREANQVRLEKYGLEDGSISRLQGRFLYALDSPESFRDGDRGDRRGEPVVSEMVALARDEVLVLERIRLTSKLYRARLPSGASKVPRLLDKTLVWDSLSDSRSIPEKIEGVALLDCHHLLLISDNDFGISGARTAMRVLDLQDRLGLCEKETVLPANRD